MSEPVKTQLQTLLNQAFTPTFLSIENESRQHSGYYEGKESHFKAIIVAKAFAGKRLVARHQSVYATVDALLTKNNGSIHALAMHTFTPEEWENSAFNTDSPRCASKTN